MSLKISNQVQQDRAKGCLAGVALGDAMGMPGELWPRNKVREHFGSIDWFLPGPQGHFVVDGFKRAQYTDDTQQTLMLAETIIRTEGNPTAESVSEDLVAWADRTGASEGNFLGPTSARAIELLRKGADPRTIIADGETNGAAMRIAPVGIIRKPDDIQRLAMTVAETCWMSHRTSVAIGAASFVAGFISRCIEETEIENTSDLLELAFATGIQCATQGQSLGDEVVAPDVMTRIKMAREIAEQDTSDEEFSQMLYDAIGASVSIIETVPAALALVWRAKANPMKTALLAANLGGDTDTIGAIATGMSGALSGLSSIPENAIQELVETNGDTFLNIELLKFRE